MNQSSIRRSSLLQTSTSPRDNYRSLAKRRSFLGVPFLGLHDFHVLVLEGIDARWAEDDVAAKPGEVADVESGVFAAHEIDQVFRIRIGHVMSRSGRGEAHEIAGGNFIDFAVDLGVAAA